MRLDIASELAALRARVFVLLAASATCAALASCGGGSGTPAPVNLPPPSVSITAAPSTVFAGQSLTLTWNAQSTGGAACDASGAWSGQVGISGTRAVAPATPGTSIFTITCGSATSSVSVAVAPAPAATNHSIPITVDNGPAAAGGALNVPYVSVTVCRPGTTVCQTIDHVMVDTGSYGLRLMVPLGAALGLPALAASAGGSVGECAQFISGYTWGGVFQADVKLAGEVASAQSIQVTGTSPGGVAAVPSACMSVGNNLGNVSALGANGILGVGLFREDCGSACVTSAVSATYYACTGSTCTPTKMPLAQQVSNPVAAFATDNNGVILTLPSVPDAGVASLSGTLTFGIGTQVDNAIAAETRYAVDANGNFVTVYKGSTMTASFLDSGSNGLFFNDSSLPTCSASKGFYCPPSLLTLTATNRAFDSSTSGAVTFTLIDVDTLAPSIIAASVGGTNGGRRSTGANAFDWGLPFFFGRRVFVGFEGGPGGAYWAY